jgi:hypothetical protein
MAKEQESRSFNEGLKKDREIYARRKLNSAEHKSFSRHENKELKSYHNQAKSKALRMK